MKRPGPPPSLTTRLLLALHRRLLSTFGQLYPGEWAGDAHRTARDAVAEAAREKGSAAAVGVAAAECLDVLKTGLAAWGAYLAEVPSGLGEGFRLPLRRLRKRPVRALAAILTLAVGIGASTAVFSVVNNTLLRPMMLDDIDTLVRIDDVVAGEGQTSNVSPLNAAALEASARALSRVVIQDYQPFVLTGPDHDPERLRGAGVSPGWAEGLGIRPVVGRTFTAREHRLGSESEAVLIGHGLWQRHWGGSAEVLGVSVTLNDRPRTVVGVLPPGFSFPYEAEVWAPLEYDASQGSEHYLLVFGRMVEGRDLTDVRSELDRLSQDLAERHPDTNADLTLRAVPLRDNLVRGHDRTAVALLSVVGFLLLVGALNVGGLSVAEGAARRREMAVRSSLGASRARQAGQLLAEAGIHVGLGAVLGLALAVVLQPVLSLLVPPVMSVELAQNDIVFDARVAAFVVGVSAVAILVAGGLPALRIPVRDPAAVLRSSGRGPSGGGGPGYGLVAVQLGLAVILLAGAGAVTASFLRLHADPPGYEPEGLLTLRASLPESRYPSGEARSRLVRELNDRLAGIPGVAAATVSTSNPAHLTWWEMVRRTDAPADRPGTRATLRYVTPDFFRTLDIPILAGRALDRRDAEGPRSTVVSRALARELWGEEGAALGRTVDVGDRDWTVVGVAGELREPATGVSGGLYLPYARHDGPYPAQEIHLFVRGGTREGAREGALAPGSGPASDPGPPGSAARASDPLSLAPLVRAAVHDLDDRLALFGVQDQSRVRSPQYVLERTGAGLAGGLVLFGLLLSGIGVFGVASHAVRSSLPALGVRKALGAPAGTLARHALAPILIAAVLGVGAGTGASLLVNRALGAVFVDLPSPDPVVYAVVSALLVVLTILAALRPALTAALVDPARVLRSE